MTHSRSRVVRLLAVTSICFESTVEFASGTNAALDPSARWATNIGTRRRSQLARWTKKLVTSQEPSSAFSVTIIILLSYKGASRVQKALWTGLWC